MWKRLLEAAPPYLPHRCLAPPPCKPRPRPTPPRMGPHYCSTPRLCLSHTMSRPHCGHAPVSSPGPAHAGPAPRLSSVGAKPAGQWREGCQSQRSGSGSESEDGKARAGGGREWPWKLRGTVGTSGVCGKKGERVENVRGKPRLASFGGAWWSSLGPGLVTFCVLSAPPGGNLSDPEGFPAALF